MHNELYTIYLLKATAEFRNSATSAKKVLLVPDKRDLLHETGQTNRERDECSLTCSVFWCALSGRPLIKEPRWLGNRCPLSAFPPCSLGSPGVSHSATTLSMWAALQGGMARYLCGTFRGRISGRGTMKVRLQSEGKNNLMARSQCMKHGLTCGSSGSELLLWVSRPG